MENIYNDYKELARAAQKELEGELGRMEEKVGRLKVFLAQMNGLAALATENKKLQDENETLRHQLAAKDQQNAEEKERRQGVEMKLTEMKKISEVMAKKASEEAILEFVRTYVNHSKRKTPDKRVFAKQATLDITNANGLTLPHEVVSAIESLDDEQTEPKVVNVQGNYNDIHDNGTVNQK